MTQEEKAKRYDETIEKLRDFYRDYDTISCLIDVKEELANLFPELAESEDEKIQKDLISFVRRQIECHDKPNVERDEKFESWIDWLEKQGNKSEEYVFRPTAGCTIDEAAQQAVDKAANGENIVFSFNGFYIKIYNNTTINDIINSYNDFCKNNVRKTQNDVMKMK